MKQRKITKYFNEKPTVPPPQVGDDFVDDLAREYRSSGMRWGDWRSLKYCSPSKSDISTMVLALFRLSTHCATFPIIMIYDTECYFVLLVFWILFSLSEGSLINFSYHDFRFWSTKWLRQFFIFSISIRHEFRLQPLHGEEFGLLTSARFLNRKFPYLVQWFGFLRNNFSLGFLDTTRLAILLLKWIGVWSPHIRSKRICFKV